MKIYISNLGIQITNESLHATFATHGAVNSAAVAIDNLTGRSRGFAFVEMPSATEALTAIQKLNGRVINGRMIRVEEAIAAKTITASYPRARIFST